MASGYTAGQWIDMVWLLLSDKHSTPHLQQATHTPQTTACNNPPPTHARAQNRLQKLGTFPSDTGQQINRHGERRTCP